MKKMTVWWKNLCLAGILISLIAGVSYLIPKSGKTVITFGMFSGNQSDVPNDDCYKLIDEAIEEFEKEYPNVEIRYTSGILKEDYSEWLSRQSLNGTLPDVFMVLPEDFTTFASVGVLKNLDTMLEADYSFDKQKYYQGCYDAGTYEGHQYALPYESVPMLMLVNKTLLKKNNLTLPDNSWTWDDFYEICQKITKDIDGDGKVDQFGVYDYSWIDAIYSNGGDVFDESGTVCNLTNDSIENAILFARDIYLLSGKQNPTSDDFDKGQIAFRPMSFSEFRTYKPYPWKINKYFDFQWDCIPLPEGPDGENLSEAETLLMGINARSKNSVIAWNFLKKLTYDQEVQQKIFQYSKGLSALKEVTDSEQTEKFLKDSIGNDTSVQVSLLNEIMERAAKKEKFQQYDTIMDYMDGEILKLFLEEGDFDMNLLKLKKKIDRMLKEY